MAREEAKEPEAPPIAANPEERPPSAECEHALEAGRAGRGARHCRGPGGALAVGGERPCDRSECGLIARTSDAARVHDRRREKSRVAQNALRHGLARAIASDEHWSEPVRLLMDAIVGGDRDEERLYLARAIAEPVMEVMRVRRARQALLDVALRTQRFGPDPLKVLGPRKYVMLAGKKLPQRGSIESDRELNPFPLDEQEDREAAIAEVVLKLSALDRYERRALSRRKFAIRDWDDYEARQKRTTPIPPSIRRRGR